MYAPGAHTPNIRAVHGGLALLSKYVDKRSITMPCSALRLSQAVTGYSITPCLTAHLPDQAILHT